MRQWQRRFTAIVLFVASTTTACVMRTKEIREDKVYVNVTKPSKQELSKEGIIISIKPIYPSNVGTEPSTRRLFNYTIRKDSMAETKSINMALIKFPFFKMTIRNTTKYAFKWTRAIIRMKDNFGNTFRPMTKTQLVNWNLSNWQDTRTLLLNRRILLSPPSSQEIRNAYDTLKLHGRDTEVGPEDTVDGYLAFNIPLKDNTEKYLAEWIGSRTQLKIQMYQIPVKTDQAGNVTKIEKFEFTLKPEIKSTTRTVKYRSLF